MQQVSLGKFSLSLQQNSCGCAEVLVIYPVIQIDLQLFKGLINLAPERHLVELLQDGFMKTFADAGGLRMIGFGSGMLNMRFADSHGILNFVK
ncbi:hypothetical protein ATY38_12390 [Nitrosomonas ureae]|nr:hypothetical protein ATY38_12390 [Nitrosomonas ureae]